jgi:hypothetical protein
MNSTINHSYCVSLGGQSRQNQQATGYAGRHLTPAELVLRNSRSRGSGDDDDSDEEAAIRLMPRSSPDIRHRWRPQPTLVPVVSASQPPPPLLLPGGGGAQALLRKYSMSGGPTALAPPAMGWGQQDTAVLEHLRTDDRQRRVSWKAINEKEGSFSMLPARTDHGLGGAVTADLSSSDEPENGGITVPALVRRNPVTKDGGSAGSLEIVLGVVELLKER